MSVWADGTQDVYEIQTLQPVSLLAGQNAQVGSLVPIPLDLKEMGVPDNMVYATIDSIGDCPAIETGSGRVVLTTVHHLNNYVFTLTLRDATGEEDTLGVTGFHKFYSETAGWESVDHLTLGETLRGADGKALTVVSVVRDPGTYEVYNMTVEADHVYYVGDLTALTHNTCPIEPGSIRSYKDFGARTNAGDGLVGHEVLQDSWLRANGLSNGNNPALALTQAQHALITKAQRLSGLLDGPTAMKTMTAVENIQKNMNILRTLGDTIGVSSKTLMELELAALKMAMGV